MASLAAFSILLCLRLVPSTASSPTQHTSLKLVDRDGEPWLLWEGPQASGAVFQMESAHRVETIGVASQPERAQAVQLAGWLGTGSVRVFARPDHGKGPPPLMLSGREIEPYLDRLAFQVTEAEDEAAWRKLGRFSSLYFSSGMGDLPIKRKLQTFLAERRQFAGPGGARWLWGDLHCPRRETTLPGAPFVEARRRGNPRLGVHDGYVDLELPSVRSTSVELEVQVEVSPTPAKGYFLEVRFESGWTALLSPGPQGGFAYQTLDAREVLEGGKARVRLVADPSISHPETRVALLRAGIRYLPGV